jgi:hypothetical protein
MRSHGRESDRCGGLQIVPILAQPSDDSSGQLQGLRTVPCAPGRLVAVVVRLPNPVPLLLVQLRYTRGRDRLIVLSPRASVRQRVFHKAIPR